MSRLLPEELWERIEPLLPPIQPSPRGGRPHVPHRQALLGILLVLKTGMQWNELPWEAFECSGVTCWRRLRDWERAGVWDRIHAVLLEGLEWAGTIDWERGLVDSDTVPAKKRGPSTGANPTDRGRAGTKRHVLTDRHGTPLVTLLSAANVHDSRMLAALIDAFAGIRRHGPGRPKKRFEKLHGDKGYDYERCREAVRQRGMTPRIGRRGVESTQKLGQHRWAVERTMSWYDGFRKLRIRDERYAEHWLALHKVANILICWRQLCRLG